MYKEREKSPDRNNITFKQLMEDNVLHFQLDITRISEVTNQLKKLLKYLECQSRL